MQQGNRETGVGALEGLGCIGPRARSQCIPSEASEAIFLPRWWGALHANRGGALECRPEGAADGSGFACKRPHWCVCGGGGVAPYYRGRPIWVCRWVREAGPCASENDIRGVCTGALRVRHPHLGQSLWP